MNELMHADIFFFITTIIVVLFGIVGLILAYYIVGITREVRYIARKVREESDNVSEDIAEIRGKLRESGMRFGGFLRTMASFFVGRIMSRPKKKSSSKRHVDDAE